MGKKKVTVTETGKKGAIQTKSAVHTDITDPVFIKHFYKDCGNFIRRATVPDSAGTWGGARHNTTQHIHHHDAYVTVTCGSCGSCLSLYLSLSISLSISM